MPIIFRYKGYRFFFYSKEGNPREPIHVHVEGGGGKAKFWLDPVVRFDKGHGFDEPTLNAFRKIIEERRSIIEGAWNEHFSD